MCVSLCARGLGVLFCHTLRSRGYDACAYPNPIWRPVERVDGYGCLHETVFRDMSRLADYFVIAGIDRDSKNGKKTFLVLPLLKENVFSTCTSERFLTRVIFQAGKVKERYYNDSQVQTVKMRLFQKELSW